jgi:hypothetical protein
MIRLFIIFTITIILSSCTQENNLESPADQHIKDYTEKQNECDNIGETEMSSSSENLKIEHNLNKETTQEAGNLVKENSIEDIVPQTINVDESTEKTIEEPLKEILPIAEMKNDLVSDLSISDYRPYDIILGDPNSKVQVIAYTSPTCAACAYYNATIFPYIKTKYIDTKKIAYVIREFIANRQDKDASILSHCAGKERFLQFMNILYSTHSSWAFSNNYLENLINIGKIGGVSELKYKECLNDTNLVNHLVAMSLEISKVPQFIGTPSFFINGQLYKKAYSEKELSKSIDAELQKFQNEK